MVVELFSTNHHLKTLLGNLSSRLGVHVVLTYWFVFDGGAGNTQVELPIFFDASVNQCLN